MELDWIDNVRVVETDQVVVVPLPAAAWAEKDGCWENHAGRIQAFSAAIVDLGRATVGDKTLVDALLPFVEELAAGNHAEDPVAAARRGPCLPAGGVALSVAAENHHIA